MQAPLDYAQEGAIVTLTLNAPDIRNAISGTEMIDALEAACDRMNADSHLRALLLGHSLTLQVSGGEVVLGQWQRILMAELDGPRARSLRVQIFGIS